MTARLKGTQRQFLWDADNKKNFQLVARDNCYKRKEDGGLSMKKLIVFHHALLTKRYWRMANDKDNTWKTIVSHKYDLTGKWHENHIWTDSWSDGSPLAQMYNSLHSIEQWRQDFVAECPILMSTNGWNMQFNRNLNDWEIKVAEKLLLRLQNIV